MRKIARRDRNHQEIVKAFESLGCSVLDLAAVGSGCPDILIAKHGRSCLIEVKDGTKCPSQRRLTEQQARFHSLWNGDLRVVTTIEDVSSIVNTL